jgi:tetratricopeptide (TPR) repeat protein
LGELLLVQGQVDEAEEQFAAVLAKNPENAVAYLGLARLSSARDDPRTSLTHLGHCLTDQATEKPARILRAECLQRLGDHEAAAEERRLARRLPDVPLLADPFMEEIIRLQVGQRANLAQARALVQQGQWEEATSLLLETAQDYPDVAEVWLALGRLFLRRGRLPEAEETLRMVLAKHPDLVDGWFYLGGVLFEQENAVEAEKHFRHAAQLQPDYAEAHHNVGLCLAKQGKRADAIAAIEEAVRYNPAFVRAHVDLAELLAQEGRPTDARQHLELAFSLDPDDTKAKQLLETFPRPARP